MRLRLLLPLFGLTMTAQELTKPIPSIQEITAKMAERDSQRQAATRGYTAVRRYVLENERHHKRAEMLVRMTCLEDGSKEFETVSETGWGAVRKHVFPRLLKSEIEASQPDRRAQSAITPANYSFAFLRRDVIDGRAVYVVAITPKTANQYLINGTIWVDASDYAITHIEGAPAKNPSFWIKSVHFVHDYEKKGEFWLPVSDRSVTDARLVGSTELTIEYFDYSLNTLALSTGARTLATNDAGSRQRR
jgi:hypothetical protein